MWRNPLADLDDLPDQPRLGLKLLAGGVVLGLVRFGWPRLGTSSFQWASGLFFDFERKFHFYRRQAPALDDLGDYLLVATILCFVAGTFIFFRRGVWKWQDQETREASRSSI